MGPTASVLLAQPLNEEQRLFIRNIIAGISTHVEGDDFSVKERSFIIIIGAEYEGELDEYASDGLPEIIGWVPKDTVSLEAGRNQWVDHLILGRLCLYFANLLDGLIDFGGELSAGANHAGTLYAVPYQAASGLEYVYHVGNTDFMEWWLHQDGLRMIK